MKLKKFITFLLLFSTITSNNIVMVKAESVNALDLEYSTFNNKEVSEETLDNAISSLDDINIQLNKLYAEISNETGLEYKYIKLLHLVAGGKSVYTDKKPNIYSDTTIESMSGPFEIIGANTEYKEFNSAECSDTSIVRPSKYYMPDAAYSVALDIKNIMTEREVFNRDGEQIYFDSLKSDIKTEIVFIESLLKYTGESEDNINSVYRIYEKLIYDKQKGENIFTKLENGTVKFKDEYIHILTDNNLINETSVNILAIVLSFDADLAINDNTLAVSEEYNIPYVENYTSRENMMVAAISLVGKCRYVWGGGHSGASYIDGINPLWIEVDEEYDNIGGCIQPSGSKCLIHGTSNSNCSFNKPVVYSLEEYMNTLSKYIDINEFEVERLNKLLCNINFSNGIYIDTLNGLDCSGYASWVYNQISDKYSYNSVASEFHKQSGVVEIQLGNKLLPGDTFAWSSHIVVIVGRINNDNNTYITVESTPNSVKFGVSYYNGASQANISKAINIAKQANTLIGGYSDNEGVASYNMSTCGIEKSIDEITGEPIEINTGAISRYINQFKDENIRISGYGKPLKEMYAQDIIQYIINKLPYSYVSGYNIYNGDIFNKSFVAKNIGINN